MNSGKSTDPRFQRKWALSSAIGRGDSSVMLLEKRGEGVGAGLEFSFGGTYAGHLTFHDGFDWQVTDSTQSYSLGWSVFSKALKLARRTHPNG